MRVRRRFGKSVSWCAKEFISKCVYVVFLKTRLMSTSYFLYLNCTSFRVIHF